MVAETFTVHINEHRVRRPKASGGQKPFAEFRVETISGAYFKNSKSVWIRWRLFKELVQELDGTLIKNVARAYPAAFEQVHAWTLGNPNLDVAYLKKRCAAMETLLRAIISGHAKAGKQLPLPVGGQALRARAERATRAT